MLVSPLHALGGRSAYGQTPPRDWLWAARPERAGTHASARIQVLGNLQPRATDTRQARHVGRVRQHGGRYAGEANTTTLERRPMLTRNVQQAPNTRPQ